MQVPHACELQSKLSPAGAAWRLATRQSWYSSTQYKAKNERGFGAELSRALRFCKAIARRSSWAGCNIRSATMASIIALLEALAMIGLGFDH